MSGGAMPPGSPARRRRWNQSPAVGPAVFLVSFILITVPWFIPSILGKLSGDEKARPTRAFTPADDRRLSERLSVASQAQGVCYGWEITKLTRGSQQRERAYGSNLGAGIDPRERPGRCPKWMMLTALSSYDSVDETWDFHQPRLTYSRRIGLDGRPPVTLLARYEDRLGQDVKYGGCGKNCTEKTRNQDDITGDRAVARLADMISGMPLLAAQEGAVPPAPAATAQDPARSLPQDDSVAGARMVYPVFKTIGCTLIAIGLLWPLTLALLRRGRAHRSRTG